MKLTMIAQAIVLIAMVATLTYGARFVLNSNVLPITWSLTCGGSGTTICVTLVNETFPASGVTDMTLRAIDTQTQIQSFNLTIAGAPPNEVFHINDTSNGLTSPAMRLGSQWIEGNYTLTVNVPQTFLFVVGYNVTAGSYVIDASMGTT